MILYIEHPKESTKILDLISKLSRIQGQWTKVGSVVFVYTSNEHLKAKLKKKFYLRHENNKILRNKYNQ